MINGPIPRLPLAAQVHAGPYHPLHRPRPALGGQAARRPSNCGGGAAMVMRKAATGQPSMADSSSPLFCRWTLTAKLIAACLPGCMACLSLSFQFNQSLHSLILS